MAKLARNLQNLTQGFTLENISVTVNQSLLNQIINSMDPKPQIQTTSGSGVQKFDGVATEDGTVFAGTNQRNGLVVLRFAKDKGLEAFERFKNTWFKPPYRTELKISSMTFHHVVSSPSNTQNLSEFREAAQTAVQMQQRSIPRVEIINGSLVIGGRSGSNKLTIAPIVGTGESVRTLVASATVRDSNGNLNRAFEANSLASAHSIIGSLLLNSIGRLTLSAFLDYLRQTVYREFDVGSVAPTPPRSAAGSAQGATPISSRAAYAVRSLTGIGNKLRDASTSEEVQGLVINWLEKLKDPSFSFIKKEEFLARLGTLFNTAPPSPPAAPPPSEEPGGKRGGRGGGN